MGKFVLSQRKDGEYQFNLVAANGQIVLTSEGYKAKPSCENGIASVKSNAANDTMFERNTASDGKLYFNLKASNGQVIGTSQRYVDQASMDTGIASVKANAPQATVEDQTA